MTVFRCSTCEATLTVPMSRVVLPVNAHQRYGHGPLGVLMEPGTYAVGEEAAGAPGAIVIAPGDVRGTFLISEPSGYACCGVGGGDGPNLLCERCGRPVATRVDDCGYWQAVRLDPRAVTPVADDLDLRAPTGWDDLAAHRPGRAPLDAYGWWSPFWEAAVAVALAHLLALSGGVPVAVPDGPVAEFFRRPIGMLLPGPAAQTMGLAGPALPPVTADILLVPEHPETGELWTPPSAAAVVPLAWDVWAQLAFARDRGPVPIPHGFDRDDPPPPPPAELFRPDRVVFSTTLAGLPEVREPWLRAIHERARDWRFWG